MRRAAELILLVLVVFVASRSIVRLLPGDPISTLLAESGTSISRQELEAQLGLDRPFLPAIFHDLRMMLNGDLGHSILTREPVSRMLAERLGNSVRLVIHSLWIGGAIALALGLAAAPGPGAGRIPRLADRICSWHGAISAALPITWIGPMLILVFAVRLRWLPLGGHVALPALALALPFSGLWARLIRERVRESLRFGAAPGARARGVPEYKVVLKYGLAPVSGPLIAYFGMQLGGFLSSGFVAEVVFNYPGMGSLLVDAVFGRDYPVVESTIFVGASLALGFTWAGESLQGWLDPRQRVLS